MKNHTKDQDKATGHNMTKHTPERWRLGTRNGERAIYGPKGEEIAVFTGMLFNDEELANARLIASAPELLTALEALLSLNEDGSLPTETDRNYFLSVIAKAKGAQ